MSNSAMDWYVIGPLRAAEDNFAAARNDFCASAESDPAYTIEWQLADVIEAQAMLEISQEFEEFTGEELERWAKRQIDHPCIRAASKSTSQASNLVEDIRTATRMNLLCKYLQAKNYVAEETA